MRAGAFWIIETNYEYALVYGCNEMREDGACDVSSEFAYVISRRAVLPGPLLRRVDYIVRRRLCIDSSRLQFTEHSCMFLNSGFHGPFTKCHAVFSTLTLTPCVMDDPLTKVCLQPSYPLTRAIQSIKLPAVHRCICGV